MKIQFVGLIGLVLMSGAANAATVNTQVTCTRKDTGEQVTLIFRNCTDYNCKVLIQDEDGNEDVLTNSQIMRVEENSEARIDLGTHDDDNSYGGPWDFFGDRNDEWLELNLKGGDGYYYRHRSDEFWSIVFPINRQIDFTECTTRTSP